MRYTSSCWLIFICLGEKIEEAKWILENYNYNRFAIGKDPLTNCYYLYLTAKIRGDVNYEERVLDEVGKTYMRHQDSWWLLYMILNLDTRYKIRTNVWKFWNNSLNMEFIRLCSIWKHICVIRKSQRFLKSSEHSRYRC